MNAKVDDLKNIVIWGNHSLTQYPDISFAYSVGSNGEKKPLKDQLQADYYQKDFISKVAKRGGEIISVMKKSSVPSAASAACDHVHDWLVGSKPGDLISMGVISDGNSYGI